MDYECGPEEVLMTMVGDAELKKIFNVLYISVWWWRRGHMCIKLTIKASEEPILNPKLQQHVTASFPNTATHSLLSRTEVNRRSLQVASAIVHYPFTSKFLD